jgi:hypothetical protein
MIKVKFNSGKTKDNLDEARTIPVSTELVRQLTGLYKKSFLKLAEVYITDEMQTAGDKEKAFYTAVLDELHSRFPEVKSVNAPIDSAFLNDLLAKMERKNMDERSKIIAEVPVDMLLQFLKGSAESSLKSFIGKNVTVRTATARIKKYFQERSVDSLGIGIELQRTAQKQQSDDDTYAGLYFAESGMISVSFEAAFFVGSIITNREGRRIRISPRLSATAAKRPETIVDYLEDELRELPVSIRHELQHFYQSLFSKVFGVADFRAGLPPRQVLKRHLGKNPDLDSLPHFSHPEEMQTDIQDEVDKFHMDLKRFIEENSDILSDNASLGTSAKKIMIKMFIGSGLNSEETALSKKLKLYRYIQEPSSTLLNIKSADKSGELYRYALRVLYTSVGDIFEESIMHKLKVVIKEQKQVLLEDLTREEIKSIIRDELEKMLKNKDSRKEIAKITKEFMKKFYRELSFNSTHIVDQVDI